MESWLLEYAARFRKDNLLASLTNGERISKLDCPKLSLLCATLTSIIEKDEYAHFDKAVCVLWELYKVVPHLIPFQEFGQLILDIKMLTMLSTTTDHNYSAVDIAKLFKIPDRIVFQNEENFIWFKWTTNEISRKMANFVAADKEGRRAEISSHFGFTNLAFLKDIKRRVDKYVEKIYKKNGLTLIEVFSRLSQHSRCKTKCIRKSVRHKTKNITNPAVSGEPSRVKTSETVENLLCSGPSGPVHGKHNSIIHNECELTADNQLNTDPHLDFGGNGVNGDFNDEYCHNLNVCDKQRCSDERGEHSRQSHCDQQNYVKRKTVNVQPRLLGTDKASKITNDRQGSLGKPQNLHKQPTNGTDKASIDDQRGNHSKTTKDRQGSLGKQQSIHKEPTNGTDKASIDDQRGNHSKTTKDRQGSLDKQQSIHNQARNGTDQTYKDDQSDNHSKTTKDRQGSLGKQQSMHKEPTNGTDKASIDDQPVNHRKTTKDCQESLGKQQNIHNQARNGTDQTYKDDQSDNHSKTTKDRQGSLGKQQSIHKQPTNGTDKASIVDDQPVNHSKITKDRQGSLGKQQNIHNQARKASRDDQSVNHSKTTKDRQGSLGKQKIIRNQARNGTDQTCVDNQSGNHSKTTKDRQESLGKQQNIHNQARKASRDDQSVNHSKTTKDCQGSLGKPQSMHKQPTIGTEQTCKDDQRGNHSKITKDCQRSLGKPQSIHKEPTNGTDKTSIDDQPVNHSKITKDCQGSLGKPQSIHKEPTNGTDKTSIDDQPVNHRKITKDCQGSLGKPQSIHKEPTNGTDKTSIDDQPVNHSKITKNYQGSLGKPQSIHKEPTNGTDKTSIDDQPVNHSKITKNYQGSLGKPQSIHKEPTNGTDKTSIDDQPVNHSKITKNCQRSLGKPQSMHKEPTNGTDKTCKDDQSVNNSKITKDYQGSLGKPQNMHKEPTNGTDKTSIDDQPVNHSKITKDCQGSLGKPQSIHNQATNGTDQTTYKDDQSDNHSKTTKDRQGSLGKQQSIHKQPTNGTDKASIDDQRGNHRKTTKDCQRSLGKPQSIHKEPTNGTDQTCKDDQPGNHSKITKDYEGSLGKQQTIHNQARNGTDQTCKDDQSGNHSKITIRNRKRKFCDTQPNERQTTTKHQIMPNVLQTSVCNIQQSQTCAPPSNINLPGNSNPSGSRYYLSHDGNSASKRVSPHPERNRWPNTKESVELDVCQDTIESSKERELSRESSATSCPKQTGKSFSNFPGNLSDYCGGRLSGECHVTSPVTMTKSISEKHPPAIQGNVPDVNSRKMVQFKVKTEPQELHECSCNPSTNPISPKAMSESKGTSLITSPCVVLQARSRKSDKTVGDENITQEIEINYVPDDYSRNMVQFKVKTEPQEFHKFSGNPPTNPISQKAMSESRGTSVITGNESVPPCAVSQARSRMSERTVGDENIQETEINYIQRGNVPDVNSGNMVQFKIKTEPQEFHECSCNPPTNLISQKAMSESRGTSLITGNESGSPCVVSQARSRTSDSTVGDENIQETEINSIQRNVPDVNSRNMVQFKVKTETQEFHECSCNPPTNPISQKAMSESRGTSVITGNEGVSPCVLLQERSRTSDSEINYIQRGNVPDVNSGNMVQFKVKTEPQEFHECSCNPPTNPISQKAISESRGTSVITGNEGVSPCVLLQERSRTSDSEINYIQRGNVPDVNSGNMVQFKVKTEPQEFHECSCSPPTNPISQKAISESRGTSVITGNENGSPCVVSQARSRTSDSTVGDENIQETEINYIQGNVPDVNSRNMVQFKVKTEPQEFHECSCSPPTNPISQKAISESRGTSVITGNENGSPCVVSQARSRTSDSTVGDENIQETEINYIQGNVPDVNSRNMVQFKVKTEPQEFHECSCSPPTNPISQKAISESRGTSVITGNENGSPCVVSPGRSRTSDSTVGDENIPETDINYIQANVPDDNSGNMVKFKKVKVEPQEFLECSSNPPTNPISQKAISESRGTSVITGNENGSPCVVLQARSRTSDSTVGDENIQETEINYIQGNVPDDNSGNMVQFKKVKTEPQEFHECSCNPPTNPISHKAMPESRGTSVITGNESGSPCVVLQARSRTSDKIVGEEKIQETEINSDFLRSEVKKEIELPNAQTVLPGNVNNAPLFRDAFCQTSWSVDSEEDLSSDHSSFFYSSDISEEFDLIDVPAATLRRTKRSRKDSAKTGVRNLHKLKTGTDTVSQNVRTVESEKEEKNFVMATGLGGFRNDGKPSRRRTRQIDSSMSDEESGIHPDPKRIRISCPSSPVSLTISQSKRFEGIGQNKRFEGIRWLDCVVKLEKLRYNRGVLSSLHSASLAS